MGLFLLPKTIKGVLQMAITLEQQRLAAGTDVLLRGVLEVLERSNPLLQRLSFRQIQGNSLTYRVEDPTKAGDVEFRAVNEGYTESTADFLRRTAVLSILGSEAFVDRYLLNTSPLEDLMSEQIMIKTKLLSRAFTGEFLFGDTGTNPKGFDGLATLVSPDQVMDMGGAELTLADLHEGIDLISNTDNAVIVTSKKGKRQLQRIYDLHPSYLTIGTDNFGATIEQFAGIQVVGVDDELMPETAGVGELPATSDIFIAELGESGVMGLQNGNGISVRNLGEVADDKVGFTVRTEWYTSIMSQSTKAIAQISNFSNAV